MLVFEVIKVHIMKYLHDIKPLFANGLTLHGLHAYMGLYLLIQAKMATGEGSSYNIWF